MEQRRATQPEPASPTASWSRRSSSCWMGMLTCPSRRRMRDRWMVNSFPHLKTDGTFRPVWAKSGWEASTVQSVGVSADALDDEMNATSTSLPWGSGDAITPGRTFRAVKSVKGKGSKTTSPALQGVIDGVVRILPEVEGRFGQLQRREICGGKLQQPRQLR